MCVEQMVKLNNPSPCQTASRPSGSTEPKSCISVQGFRPACRSTAVASSTGPHGVPFGGFQWRNDAALNLNWIWLQNYIKPPRAGASMKFDHLVVAKSHIGCL